MSKTSEKSFPPQSASIMCNLYYTPFVDGAFLPKRTDYSQYAKGPMQFVTLLKFYVCDPLFYVK